MSLDDFDPNQPKYLLPIRWAVYKPQRYNGADFKTYKHINHALSSFKYAGRNGTILYEMIDGKWVEIDRKEP